MNFALNQNNLPWNWNVYYFFFGQVKPRPLNVTKKSAKTTVESRYSLLRNFYYEHQDDVRLLLSGFVLDSVIVSMPLPEHPFPFAMQFIMTLIGAYARRRYLYLDNLLFREFGSFLMLAIMFITGHQLIMSVFTMLISTYLAINSTKRKPLIQEGIELSLVCISLLMLAFGTPFTVLYAILTSVFAPFSIMFYLIVWSRTFKPEVITSTTSNGNEASITSNDTTLVPVNGTN